MLVFVLGEGSGLLVETVLRRSTVPCCLFSVAVAVAVGRARLWEAPGWGSVRFHSGTNFCPGDASTGSGLRILVSRAGAGRGAGSARFGGL